MKKLMRNRTVIGILCIVLAFVMCFVLTPLFNRSVEAKTEIVRFTKEVHKGEQITQTMIEHVKVGNYNLPETVIKKKEQAVGMYAATDFSKGDYIITGKLSKSPLSDNGYLMDLDGSKQAISITIQSFAAGLSGKLEGGDIISVIACEYGDLRETVIPDELKYVKVLAVTTDNGTDKDTTTITTQEEEAQDLPSTVTVLADEVQAKLLAELEQSCKVHISMVYRGSKENADKFLAEQDRYNKEHQAGQEEATYAE